MRSIQRSSSGPGIEQACGQGLELARHRSYLLRRARLRLGGADLAEDVVQETLVAALLGLDRFDRRSSLRTWLVGILHHKIVDEIRNKVRHRQAYGPDNDRDRRDALDEEDDSAAQPWRSDRLPAPEADAGARQLYAVVEERLAGMPHKHATAFVMRDIMDHTSERICAELGITSNNLFVMLHRTRSALRRTLEAQGYERPSSLRRNGTAR